MPSFSQGPEASRDWHGLDRVSSAGIPLMRSNPTDHSSAKADGDADVRALWDHLEQDLAESICKALPGTADWRPFANLLSDSVERALAAFPGVSRSSVGFPLTHVRHSLIDDALREVQAMFSEALERQGVPREATALLSDWIDYRTGMAMVQFQIAALRARLHAEAPSVSN